MTGSRRAPVHRNLEHWLAHIQTQHWRSIDLQLDRIARVWETLGGRRSGLVISVAGTNGKGSCVAALDAVLRQAGLKTGSYTSPHLVRYNERVRINGRAADDAALCEAFADIERARGGIPLTYFEFGTLCALLIFERQRVDASILEVGMGGRLDAVNLIANDIALITSVGIDHAQWLGDNRDAIAAQKAGILKNRALAVCADPAPPPCIARIAAERDCLLMQSGIDYRVERREHGIVWRSCHPAVAAGWRRLHLQAPLNGAPQAANLGGVVATLALTRARTGVTEKNLVDGLARTTLAGRCQVLKGAPEIVLDVAHNADSAAALAGFLARRPTPGKTHGVFAALADKPVAHLIAATDGAIDRWYLATLDGDRGQDAGALQAALAAAGSTAPASTHATPVAAYRAALAAAGATDRIVVFGSFHLVGAIMAHLEQAGMISIQ